MNTGSRLGAGLGVSAPPPPTAAAGPAGPQARETGIEVTFRVEASGVAMFRTETGIMTERVWQATGRATASYSWGVGIYRNLGRIRQLAPDEPVDVGPTGQVGWPGKDLEGLPSWVAIDDMPEAPPG
jgi:hypothetical protein